MNLINGVDVSSYFMYQDLDYYFRMLNGPTYEELVKYLWVRAEVYDKEAAKREETKKILLDPSLEGKPREEMGLKEFTRTEIHSSVLGIPVTISEEAIARVARCSNEGKL